jgi:ATP-binding cassette subfamily B protein
MLISGHTRAAVSLMIKIKQYASVSSFLTYLSSYKWQVLAVFVSFAIAHIFIAIIPIFIGKLVGVLAESPVDTNKVSFYVTVLLILSTGHNLLWRFSEFLYIKLLYRVSFQYENVLFSRIVHQPYPYFVDKFTGKISSLITRLSQELRDQMEKVFWDYAEQIITLLTVAIILTAINWQTGAVFTGGIVAMMFIGRKTVKNSLKYEKIWTDVESTKNGKIIDAIANFVNIKSFRKELYETRLIGEAQLDNSKAANNSFMWSMVFWASMGSLVRTLIWPSVILLNVYFYLRGEITLADLTTVFSALVVFSSFIWDLIWSLSQLSLRLSRMEESHTYLFGKVNICQGPAFSDATSKDLVAFEKSLTFNNLNFSYPDNKSHEVLSAIKLEISKNQKLGIVGKSGSGKTTLTKLMLGYYSIADNVILIDGVSVKTDEIAQLVSYVPQDTTLFHRSIADNIAYATNRKVSRSEIVDAAKKAHADEFITRMPGGYDALVGERGVKLSAGQRQRIAIARAFLDNKPLLILDEATSALDSESEILIQQALEDLWKDKTVLAIAHRLSTLRHMDKIVVIDKGKITEAGTHAQLLEKKGTYAQLWSHQSGGFIEE